MGFFAFYFFFFSCFFFPSFLFLFFSSSPFPSPTPSRPPPGAMCPPGFSSPSPPDHLRSGQCHWVTRWLLKNHTKTQQNKQTPAFSPQDNPPEQDPAPRISPASSAGVRPRLGLPLPQTLRGCQTHALGLPKHHLGTLTGAALPGRALWGQGGPFGAAGCSHPTPPHRPLGFPQPWPSSRASRAERFLGSSSGRRSDLLSASRVAARVLVLL